MTGSYGKGQYCPAPGSPLFKYAVKAQAKSKGAAPCLHLEDLSRVLAKSRDFAELVEAWRGWHATAAPMKEKYARYVELANEGAKEIGFDDVGALWRAGYDMPPADFEADIERLWSDVKPLYDELHCYVRARLQAKYGKDKVPDHAPIPAQLLGNMWAQEWNNIAIWSRRTRASRRSTSDKALEAGHWDAVKMVKQGERFFTGLGFDPLPETFWERSLFTRPRDRDVVCHASAWDVTWSGDLRVKVCLEPTEEDFVTIHHELGHDFYFQRYEKLPILFQQGANDGFHEAIGDTIALSVTPDVPAGPRAARRRRRGRKRRGGPRAHQPADEDGAREGRLPAVRPAHRQVAMGRLLRQGRPRPTTTPRGGGSRRSTRASARRRRVRPTTSTPARSSTSRRARRTCATSSRASTSFSSTARSARRRALQGRSTSARSTTTNRRASASWRCCRSGRAGRGPTRSRRSAADAPADAAPMLEYFAPLRTWLAEQNKGRQCGW